MSKIDEHRTALKDVETIRAALDDSNLRVSEAHVSEDREVVLAFFAIDQVTGRRRDVSALCARLMADAVRELWCEVADKSIQLAESRERRALDEARTEVIAYLASSGFRVAFEPVDDDVDPSVVAQIDRAGFGEKLP